MTNIMTRWTMAGVLACVLAPAAVAIAQPRCDRWIWIENRSRYVYGEANGECTYGCPWFYHSHLWGNWGVDTSISGRTDSQQFMGWKSGQVFDPCSENMSTPQWNSCTSDTGRPRGDGDWYNWDGNTTQYSGAERTAGALSMWISSQCPCDWNGDGAVDSGGCGTPGLTYGGVTPTMDIYELDMGGDEYVTTAEFPGCCGFEFYCNDAGTYCTGGASAWASSAGNSILSAEARGGVDESIWMDWGNCCMYGCVTIC